MPLDCIKYRLDFCLSDRKEVQLSVIVRTTAAALGMFALFIFACIISQAPWYQPANLAILVVGVGLLIASTMLKCANKREPVKKDITVRASRLQARPKCPYQMKETKKTNPLSSFLQIFPPFRPVRVNFLEILPNEIQSHCISYLTLQQRAVFAQVCKQAQYVAEDDALLMQHYRANHELTIRQLLRIADHAVDEQLKSEIENKIEFRNKFRQTLLIESKTIIERIEKLEIKGKKITLKDRWRRQFFELANLERKLLDSLGSDFSKISLMQIMIKHLELMKSQGLKLNNCLYMEDVPPSTRQLI